MPLPPRFSSIGAPKRGGWPLTVSPDFERASNAAPPGGRAEADQQSAAFGCAESFDIEAAEFWAVERGGGQAEGCSEDRGQAPPAVWLRIADRLEARLAFLGECALRRSACDWAAPCLACWGHAR